MFVSEARIAANMRHPNIVLTYDAQLDAPDPILVMEFIEGQPLNKILKRLASQQRPLALPAYLLVLRQLLEGLHYAHELVDTDGSPLRLVHRDVSPHNVIVGYDGRVKILDFGIARGADATGETRTGVIKGKIKYMPPEQLSGEIDRRVDVFAVGCMLWQAIAGRELWQGVSDVEIVQRLLRGDLPRVPESGHPTLRTVCARALAVPAAERYPTALDLAEDLDSLLELIPELRYEQRDLGDLVAELFADERKRILDIVRAEFEAIEAKPRLTEIKKARADERTLPDAVEVLPPEPARKRSGRSVGSQSRTSTLILSKLFAATAVVVLLLVLALKFVVPALHREPARENLAREEGETLVVMAVAPSHARVYLDDVPVPNPVYLVVPFDNLEHRVRADAAGYASRAEHVHFVRGVMRVHWVLMPISSPEPVDSRRTSQTAPTSHSQVVPTASVRSSSPHRSDRLDRSDPWPP
jgi:serine/threonine-protein kinase